MVTFRSHFTLSGFGDEIDADFETQLEVMSDLGLSAIDLRGADDTNVLDFSESQVEGVHDLLAEYGFDVACIGSPIGKVGIGDDFDEHLDRFETALDTAEEFDTEYIRLFSYYIPEEDEPEDYREEVMDRMAAKAERAEERGITLLHENEKDIYGDTPARCRDMIETVGSPSLRAIFDPANFLEIGVQPYPDALLQLVEHVEYLHIKDAQFGERGEIEPAGEGDGNIPEVLDALQQRGFSGYAALEPHLAHAGRAGGYSGPEAFEVAADALKDCLDSVDASYS
ncbi:MAG: sugar phosphate isomerase/epimerase family protein [Halobacteriales archaeon]